MSVHACNNQLNVNRRIMDEKISNHPCHRLSIPSAKLFWCRHCMQSFEDPITRWRHSKSCKTGGIENHEKRIEQDVSALQQYCESKQREDDISKQNHGTTTEILETVTGEQLVIVKHETVENENEVFEKIEQKGEYSCFICKRPFPSLEDMKEHVKYPCSKREPIEYGSILIPGSGGTTFIDPPTNYFPNSSRKQQVIEEPIPPKPKMPMITRQPVLGEIVEQSADPSTGVRTFEVHSQNDDIPLSDILSKLSEGGYLVAGEEASAVNQVVVVQQVDEKGQITQTEHILPPHIQIQQGVQGQEPQSETQEAVPDEIEADVIDAIQGIDENSQEGEITYYITETGQLVKDPMELKSGNKELFYYDDDQFAGMNILTQAAEATMGNLIYPEKRKAEEDEDENVKRSRVQCKPDEEFGSNNPPEPPRSPRNDYPSFENGTIRILGRLSQSEATNSSSYNNDGQNGKQQSSNQGEQPMDTTESLNSRYIDRSLSVDLPISSHLARYPQSDLNQNNSELSNSLPSPTPKKEKPKIPNKGRESPPKKSKKSRRRYSYEDEFKCRICDKTFRTSQLLSRHSQYPCKIFNTRNMSQKVLRPKRGTNVGKLLNTSNQKSSSKNPSHNTKSQASQKTVVNVYRKPMLLLHGLKVSTLFEEKKKSKKVKKRPEPSYIPTLPRTKTIWLPNEKLIMDELPEKEQFFYELDLVGCYHLSGEPRPNSPVNVPNIFNPENKFLENQSSSEKTNDVFTPLTISTDIDCSRNISLLEDFSPPILERMDLVNSPELSSPNLPDEPPVLIPVIEAVTKSEKILDDSDYTFDFSSTPKSKTPETRRHFMDLFIEASPITAQKQNGSQQLDDADAKKSPLKNMITKNDLISKLTNSLKKKLTPQKILPMSTEATIAAKRSLLPSFDNISVHDSNAPVKAKKRLVLPISKLNGVKSPSKLNVVIFKQKSQFRKFVERKTITKQVFADQELEDDICELLDYMLEKVATQNAPNIGSFSDLEIDSDVKIKPEKMVKDASNSFESETSKTENSAPGTTSWKELKGVLHRRNEIKKLLNSMLKTVMCRKISEIDLDKTDIQNLMNKIVNKVTHSCETSAKNYQLTDEVREILDQIVCKVSDKQIDLDVQQSLDQIVQNIVDHQTNFEVGKILNEMVSNVVSKYQADLMRNEISEILNKIVREISENLEVENLEMNRNSLDCLEMDTKSDVNANNLTSKLETIKIEVDDGEDMFFVMKDGNLILKEMVSDFEADDFSQTTDSVKNESPDSNESFSDDAKDSDFNCGGEFQNGFSNSDDSSNSKSDFNSNSQSVLHDEGIVSDISAADNSERDMLKNEATRPNVTVQYIPRINSVDALTSEKLNFGLDNDFDKEGSPDYIVSKIVFNEEEIVLNDSGLDDSDEIVSQSSLDSNNILQDVPCYTKFA
ncbi:hypothetical protein LOTGIDRAFT_163332 [Lottia gigantea]|uniref:C2H2-type domain-containing protein n=1 Tax=Lottia gigantea TaxID=225164 RepID=V4A4H6_LOTGI|nr:hypothetical protein LOTGIDRAFT_163332 [Lottia gigantea]ESO91607.1 hypothetical protein LOTGIDRAFT_163332 [Lottia gigantea]